MNRLEIGKIVRELTRLAPFRRAEGDVPAAANPEAPAPAVPEASAAEDALYALLRRQPGAEPAPDARMLALCRAQVEGFGEDAFLAVRDGDRALLAAFDGCGGSGAKTYEAFGGHTGAWAASRAASLAARQWFAAGDSEADLAACLACALQKCKSREPAGQVLLGGLSKAFPTTVAAFAVEKNAADIYWCGDSRAYLLDAKGLHALTRDDSAVQDALRALREDAPMTNVACASQPFQLHRRRVALNRPAVLLAATDGCFGYLPSPMAFERLLLEALCRAASPADVRKRLDAAIRAVSGDDYTLVAWAHGFKGFKAMQKALHARLSALEKGYPAAGEDALERQWAAYKAGYESMLESEA